MPAPGYVFRDGGATPPPEDAEERAFAEWKQSRSRSATVGTQLPPTTTTTATTTTTTTTTTTRAAPETSSTSRGKRSFSLLHHRPNLSVGTSTSTSTGHAVNDFRGGSSSIISSKRTSRDNRYLLGQPDLVNSNSNSNNEAVRGGDAADDDANDDNNKGRASIDRLYSTVGSGLIALGGHLSRLRSWQHPAYTGAYGAVYALAWVFNVIVPTLLLGVIVLIAVPEARSKVFPPATSADENALHRHNRTLSGASAGAAASKRLSATTNGTLYSNRVSLERASNAQPTKPAAAAIRTHLLHVSDWASDMWERVANAISPTPPFTHHKRLELAAILIPVFLLSLGLGVQQIVRVVSLLAGLVFFGKPVIRRGVDLLDARVPQWKTYVDPRSTLFEGVPNNAELAAVLRAAGAGTRAGASGNKTNGLLITSSRGSVKATKTGPASASASTSTSAPGKVTAIIRSPSTATPAASSNGNGNATPKSAVAATTLISRPASASVSRPVSTTAVPPVPPIPQSPTSAKDRDRFPPSSFRNGDPGSASAAQDGSSAARRSLSLSRTRSRARSLSRSRFGRKIASVLHHNSRGPGENGQDDGKYDGESVHANGRNLHQSGDQVSTISSAAAAAADTIVSTNDEDKTPTKASVDRGRQ